MAGERLSRMQLRFTVEGRERVLRVRSASVHVYRGELTAEVRCRAGDPCRTAGPLELILEDKDQRWTLRFEARSLSLESGTHPKRGTLKASVSPQLLESNSP